MYIDWKCIMPADGVDEAWGREWYIDGVRVGIGIINKRGSDYEYELREGNGDLVFSMGEPHWVIAMNACANEMKRHLQVKGLIPLYEGQSDEDGGA